MGLTLPAQPVHDPLPFLVENVSPPQPGVVRVSAGRGRRELILTTNPQVAGIWRKHDLLVMGYIPLGCSWACAPCMLPLALSHSLSHIDIFMPTNKAVMPFVPETAEQLGLERGSAMSAAHQSKQLGAVSAVAAGRPWLTTGQEEV